MGAREDDLSYERGALKRCEKVGITVRQVVLPEDAGQQELMDNIRKIRDEVNKALENARNQKTIGKSLEAQVTLKADGELYDFLKENEAVLEPVFIVSKVVLEQGAAAQTTAETEGLEVTVSKAHGEKCERCWAYSDTVGKDEKHPTLCARCAAIIG